MTVLMRLFVCGVVAANLLSGIYCGRHISSPVVTAKKLTDDNDENDDDAVNMIMIITLVETC